MQWIDTTMKKLTRGYVAEVIRMALRSAGIFLSILGFAPGLGFAAGSGGLGPSMQERPFAVAPPGKSRREDHPLRWQALPSESLLVTYRADPHATAISVRIIDATDNSSHIGNSVGAIFPLVQVAEPAEGGRCLQLVGMVGVWNRFDLHQRWDGIAEDWRFGFGALYRMGKWIPGVHYMHESDHLVDEYVLRTGAQRIAYRREEVKLSLDYRPATGVRLYALGAHAFALGPLNRPGRVQGGFEIETGPFLGLLRPYLAVDVQARAENSWRADIGGQIGVALRRPEGRSTLRFHLDVYRGCVPFGELFQERTRYIAFGISVDL